MRNLQNPPASGHGHKRSDPHVPIWQRIERRGSAGITRLPRVDSLPDGELKPRIERHTWTCANCKAQGMTVSTSLTDVPTFTGLLFRDHDLKSPTCNWTDLTVFASNGKQVTQVFDWLVSRPK
jgi:hypothetical protein